MPPEAAMQQKNELKEEMQSLRHEIVELREDYVRKSNARKIAEEKERQQALKREEARFNKLYDVLIKILQGIERIGSSPSGLAGVSNEGEGSLQERADAVKEHVKLFTALEIMEPTRGNNMFAGTSSDHSPFEDGPAVVKGAIAALGPDIEDEDIAGFLNNEITIMKKRKGSKAKSRILCIIWSMQNAR